MNQGDAVVICDVGRIGPGYLPAHAHADTLSFEFSIGATRVLVNGGTSTYEAGGERHRERGTAAHNTVVIDGRNSSDVWGVFRVGRRATPTRVTGGASHAGSWLEGGHDGYQHAGGITEHRRRWQLNQGELVIQDRIDGKFRDAEARFHLHPDVSVQSFEEHAGRIVLVATNGSRVTIDFGESSRVALETSEWHPEFGTAVPSRSIRVGVPQGGLRTRVMW